MAHMTEKWSKEGKGREKWHKINVIAEGKMSLSWVVVSLNTSILESVHASNGLNGSVSLLGSQYTYNMGFGFPTLGDSNLETQRRFYNHWTTFPSLFVALDLDLRLSFQNFNNRFLSLALYILLGHMCFTC